MIPPRQDRSQIAAAAAEAATTWFGLDESFFADCARDSVLLLLAIYLPCPVCATSRCALTPVCVFCPVNKDLQFDR